MHALDWDDAEREYLKAIRLSPAYARAHLYYATFLMTRNRPDEAIAEARETLKLDPVSIAAESNLAVLYYHAGRNEEALASCRRALEMEPALPRPYDDLGRILLEKGAFTEAIAALEKSVSLSDREPQYLSSLGYACGITGKIDAARRILMELTEKAEHRYVAPSDLALVYVGLSDQDQALYWLQRAYNDRDAHVLFVHVDPRFARLRSNLGFPALLARAGLSTAGNAAGGETRMLGEVVKGRSTVTP